MKFADGSVDSLQRKELVLVRGLSKGCLLFVGEVIFTCDMVIRLRK